MDKQELIGHRRRGIHGFIPCPSTWEASDPVISIEQWQKRIEHRRSLCSGVRSWLSQGTTWYPHQKGDAKALQDAIKDRGAAWVVEGVDLGRQVLQIVRTEDTWPTCWMTDPCAAAMRWQLTNNRSSLDRSCENARCMLIRADHYATEGLIEWSWALLVEAMSVLHDALGSLSCAVSWGNHGVYPGMAPIRTCIRCGRNIFPADVMRGKATDELCPYCEELEQAIAKEEAE